jgi:hypothetical protein
MRTRTPGPRQERLLEARQRQGTKQQQRAEWGGRGHEEPSSEPAGVCLDQDLSCNRQRGRRPRSLLIARQIGIHRWNIALAPLCISNVTPSVQLS